MAQQKGEVKEMINTRILTQEFDYFAPESIKQVVELLERHGEGARVIAGGTDLINQMKEEKMSPSCLVNIMNVKGLRYIKEDEGLRIGAATKLRDVRAYCFKSRYVALYEAISSLGKPQVWNMGTIGGNLCNASPAADTAPPLLVFKARVKLVGKDGERELLLEDFFTGVNSTVLQPTELMVEIHLDPPGDGAGNAFLKVARVGADISKVSCAVFLKRQGRTCTECRVALGAVAPVPMRVKVVEEMIEGREIEESLVAKASEIVSEEVKPIDDIRSSAEYRRQVAAVTFRDVFWKAWDRAIGGKN
ncbi:MAG: xanthine dehydrogenase family protein subunit M [Deltaproteobacteria bacterium]|nr:MAG: xanthine dehydrogenase family protein subunit M [Deltaproteobacteria bacterium]